MLKHTGERRTHLHNVRLAVLLSLTAGFINGEGFLGFAVFTTNVTGHAAIFAEHIYSEDWTASLVVALWMLLFLAGAFFSGFIIDIIGENQRYSNLIPISIELAILITIGIWGNHYKESWVVRQTFTGSLLFAMGLQNALVTKISNSVVRTTHLTGTFTDLGIELALLKFVEREKRPELKSSIWLKIIIISFFIIGVIGGTYTFGRFKYHSFWVPAFILVFALMYDVFRVNAKKYYRKIEKSFMKMHASD